MRPTCFSIIASRILGSGWDAASTLLAWMREQRTILDFWSGIGNFRLLIRGVQCHYLVYAHLALAGNGRAGQNERPMIRLNKSLRRAGALLLHFFIAVFGVAVII